MSLMPTPEQKATTRFLEQIFGLPGSQPQQPQVPQQQLSWQQLQQVLAAMQKAGQF